MENKEEVIVEEEVVVEDRAPQSEPVAVVTEAEKNHALIIWALMGFGFVTGGVTSLCAVIFALFTKDDKSSEFSRNHSDRAIKLFIQSIIIGLIGWVTTFIFIGIFILFGLMIYSGYVIAKGLIRASDRKLM